ncbi:hypothetical protein IAR55_006361 [Kwoniella newhampshirensis]|uniref:Two-component system sensor protein n=1 Tax=Kwoniella newhampshirensis TaxID=1651941 RepID=A0AAW0YV65_9TREE
MTHDLTTLDGFIESETPITYLQTYPFPACIVQSHLDASAAGPSRQQVAWKNERWVNWMGKHSLDGLIEGEALLDFERWISTGEADSVFPMETDIDTLFLMKTIIPRKGSYSLHVITSLPSKAKRAPTLFFGDTPSGRTPSAVPSTERPANLIPSHLDLSAENVNDAVSSSLMASSVLASRTLDCKSLLDRTDWTKTSLGPRVNWSPVIETMIEVILRSPTQDALWLGEDFLMLYNDNYAQIVDHPLMWARSARAKEAWGPVWEGVTELIERCLSLGEPCYRENDLLLYRRGLKGHWVEKYHTWSFIPLFDAEGKPLGLFNPTRDTTEAVVARRRQETMRDLSEQLLTARTSKEYYNGIIEVLEQNPKDVPFLMCYSVQEVAQSNTVKLTLESSLGVPPDHPAAPRHIDIALSNEQPTRSSFSTKTGPFSSPTLSAISTLSSGGGRVRYSFDQQSWPIAKSISSRQAVVVDDCTRLIKGFPLRQWEALPESAIVIPISSEASADTPQAVFILGLNIASPLDTVYEDWIHVLRAHLISSLGSVRAAEAAHERQMERDRMETAKTAWFQGAAHDLRSPLTLVAGPLDDVLRTQLRPDQRSMLSLAQRNLARVQRLVNSLLDFSRIEAGKMSGRFVPLDLGRFVGDLAALFQPAVNRKRIAYRIEIEPHEGLVFVDPTLLETVVTNLISNALKYTERGAISVALSYYETFADIAITDSGIGIPTAELSAVTDRFHRATTALSRGTEGTGIGLALAKEIVRLHGGDLLIISQTAEESGGPHGSTFTARIPLVERDVSTDQLTRNDFGLYGKAVVDEAMHWFQPSDYESESVGSELNGSTSSRSEGFLFERSDVLLLVDDNNDMRNYVKSIFKPYCQVIEAVNGQQALELARKTPPDLILSDLMMPKMNGQELLAAIRQDPITRFVPMVLLSAATDDELRLAAFVEGVEDFMLKPFKPKELLARVHLHMQIGKKRAHLEMLYAQRQQELAVILDYSPSGLMRADNTGKIIYGNDTYRSYSGMARDADLNDWPGYVDPETLNRLDTAWHEIVHGDQRESTLTWKFTNGTSVSGTFVRLDLIDPTMSGVLGCLSDISYQEEKLHEAERRRVEAEEAKQQQELLVDLTSHEIRTPVSAILQCSSLAKENLLELQQQLLHVGSQGFRPTPQQLAELDEDIQALDTIEDTGPGLAPNEQAALFKRFSQGNKMVHTKYGGSGLGLFICKRISELLGGRIEMESELGVGSGAYQSAERALDSSLATLAITTPTPTLSPSGPTPISFDGLHLLIVEDNIINQTVLKRQIIKAGFTCDVANNGQEALDYIHAKQSQLQDDSTKDNRRYDVILMDLEMPVMDGLTAVKHIRQDEASGDLDRQLVIALTGNARQGQIEQAMAAGMDDVIIKPYKLPDLISKLKNKIDASNKYVVKAHRL